jgi:neutral ceramidase
MAMLQAGAARVVITPPLGVPLAGYFMAEGRKETAREVHDDLYARALVLHDGKSTLAIVTADLIALGDEELAMVREEVQRKAGIAPADLMLACTHTHSGPVVHPFPPSEIVPGQADADYFRLLPRLIASAVAMAAGRLRPARIGAGKGSSSININRREKLPDGSLRGLPYLGRNPDGIHDRELGVLRVDDALSGKPLAVLLSYACHPVVLGPNSEISADYVGYTLNFLERSLGAGALALFANGAQGDMNPIIHPGSFADAERLGLTLGAEALQVTLCTQTAEDVRLATATRRVELPLNPASTPERQRAYISFLQQEHARFTRESDALRAWDIEMRLDVATYRLYHREQLRHTYMAAEVSAFGIHAQGAGIGLVAEPAELFCEYGMQARKSSPFSNTLVLGLANGFIGYVPTPDVYTEGGYESEATNVAPQAGELLCQAMIDVLQAVAG